MYDPVLYSPNMSDEGFGQKQQELENSTKALTERLASLAVKKPNVSPYRIDLTPQVIDTKAVNNHTVEESHSGWD